MGDDRVKNEALEIMGLFQALPRLVVFDLDYTLWPFYCENCQGLFDDERSRGYRRMYMMKGFKKKQSETLNGSRRVDFRALLHTMRWKCFRPLRLLLRVVSRIQPGLLNVIVMCAKGLRPTHNTVFGECRSKREMPSLYPHAKGILFALKEKGIDVAIASRSPTVDIAKTFLDKLDIRSMFVSQEIFSSWTHKTEHFQRINRRTGVPYNSMLFFDDEDRNIEAVSKMGVTSILVGNGVNLGAFRQGLMEFSQNSGSSSRRAKK